MHNPDCIPSIAPIISVIICTHNPRPDYLNKVIAALKVQTLPTTSWELLLIDNASDRELASQIDLSWHPRSCCIREEELGLTPARLRGIREAKAEILVFVDDDNVLDPDYLEVAHKTGDRWPILGAWGGQTKPGFEETPADWTRNYWEMLGIRELTRDRWSNLLHQHETTPCGAGMCIRKFVADKYAENLQNNNIRLNLDRKGNSLVSCGDADLAFTACEMGLGTGLFVALKLTHLMPKHRLEEEYLLKLREAMAYSDVMLDCIRGKRSEPPTISGRSKLFESYVLWRSSPRERRFYSASQRGYDKAVREIADAATFAQN
jgi:glycosyltransferase involved in cell wall biosynthesis